MALTLFSCATDLTICEEFLNLTALRICFVSKEQRGWDSTKLFLKEVKNKRNSLQVFIRLGNVLNFTRFNAAITIYMLHTAYLYCIALGVSNLVLWWLSLLHSKDPAIINSDWFPLLQWGSENPTTSSLFFMGIQYDVYA